MTTATEQHFGIDLARLERWMDAQGIAAGPISDVVRLPGGTQNILLRFRRGTQTFVVRRGPENLRDESNRIITREARLLAALEGTNVPHPAFIAGSDGPEALGASFYLTAFVPGFNATLDPPPRLRTDAGFRHRLGLELVGGLARLAALDPLEMGLADFGRLEGFLERQTGRWTKQLDSYDAFANWTGRDELPGLRDIREWLDSNLPPRMQPGIIHGDYHLGNVIFDADGRLAAIADWEMATLGDPLLDLGRLLSTWPDENGDTPLSLRVEPADGFPRRSELIAEYVRLTGRDLTHLRWFEILSCFKLGIILEGTYARSCAGLVDSQTGDRLHRSAIALLQRALGWIADDTSRTRQG